MNLGVLHQVGLQVWQEHNHGPSSNIPMPDPGLMSRSRVENMINAAYKHTCPNPVPSRLESGDSVQILARREPSAPQPSPRAFSTALSLR